jgi:OmcA/MtrC family decaheme c-type cytochrome
VKEVTLTSRTSGTHYSLTASTGTVTELTDSFGANKVVATYTSDFVMPSVYPPPVNDSPDLDETWGEWAGKSLADGTYTVTLYGAINRTWSAGGENTSYTGTAEATSATFLVGSAATTEPYAVLSSGTNCYRCHDDLYFHGGGRRGFNACVMCHGTSGFEDRPRYVAPNAPSTTATPASFRTMLHKIHMGEDLPDSSTYTIVGFGSAAYPNNYSANLFDEIGFPVLIGGLKSCAVCHGATNDHWKEPPSRDHPTQQVKAARVWRATCGACHSSSAAQAHIDANTALASNGAEACAVCHGAGKEWPVEVVHKVR